MSGLVIKYKETTGDLDTYLENEPWFPLVAEHTWNSETYEGTITLNEGVTELPAEYEGQTCTYFNSYETLTEIEFPEGLIRIRAESSVNYLSNLEKLIVPDTVDYLGNYFGSMNSSEQSENPTMDFVLPTGLRREYYHDVEPSGIFDASYFKTVTFNVPKDFDNYGYYQFFFGNSSLNIKDAVYINCAPAEFGEYQPQFINFSLVDEEHPIDVYVDEKYYDRYDFDTFFTPEQREKIANIIRYNPEPVPPVPPTPTKKSSFNLEGMLDVDYMRQ